METCGEYMDSQPSLIMLKSLDYHSMIFSCLNDEILSSESVKFTLSNPHGNSSFTTAEIYTQSQTLFQETELFLSSFDVYFK